MLQSRYVANVGGQVIITPLPDIVAHENIGGIAFFIV